MDVTRVLRVFGVLALAASIGGCQNEVETRSQLRSAIEATLESQNYRVIQRLKSPFEDNVTETVYRVGDRLLRQQKGPDTFAIGTDHYIESSVHRGRYYHKKERDLITTAFFIDLSRTILLFVQRGAMDVKESDGSFEFELDGKTLESGGVPIPAGPNQGASHGEVTVKNDRLVSLTLHTSRSARSDFESSFRFSYRGFNAPRIQAPPSDLIVLPPDCLPNGEPPEEFLDEGICQDPEGEQKYQAR